MDNSAPFWNKVSKKKLIFLFIILIIIGLFISFYLSKSFNLNIAKQKQLINSSLQDEETKKPNEALFHCPSIPSFCQTGTINKGIFSGKITSNAPLFAVFDGTAREQLQPEINRERFKAIVLTSITEDKQASYYFHGTILKQGGVRKGEIIATSSGQPVIYLGGNSLYFTIVKQLDKIWTSLPLSKDNFN